ncbi:beta-xylosidase [Halalkalibacter hemicellulosilyticusJCM 9152]|uniref:Beta-xylosidase n=1 Tax=Halalkalibacter hemicellulosilyticusJCM 9152 TaxID=1236971 RepID=W4QCP7_9BACI|nr:beta-xylosidase [Halalkalibacter hemicellulosilyticusJCM 9152]
MRENLFYNAHHSPIGAFASFTLGFKGAKGGLGLELDKPANENVYIGLESRETGYYEALPFFGDNAEDLARFALGNDETIGGDQLIRHFADDEIKRELKLGTDTWKA